MTFNGEFEAASAEYGIRALSSGEAKWLEEQTEKRCKEYVDEFGGVRLIDKDGQPVVIKSGDTVRIKVEGELFQGEKELVFWALGDSNRVYRAADIKRVEPTVDGVKQPVYYEFQTKDLSALLFGVMTGIEYVEPTETPEPTEKPEEPEVTEKPEEPEVTEKPEVPEVTEKPEEPEVTEKPEEPEVTEKPEEPEVTETPDEPEVTETPDEPEVTETPEIVDEPKEFSYTESFNGSKLTVQADAGVLPNDAKVVFSWLSGLDEETAAAYDKAVEYFELGEMLVTPKLMKINFVSGDEAVEPEGTVNVELQLAQFAEAEKNMLLRFDWNKTEEAVDFSNVAFRSVESEESAFAFSLDRSGVLALLSIRELKYPAQEFEISVNGVNFTVVSPEGALPEGSSLIINNVGSEALTEAAEKTLGESLVSAEAFRLRFIRDGESVVPGAPVSITAQSDMIAEAAFMAVLSHDDELNTNVIWAGELSEESSTIAFRTSADLLTLAQTSELAAVTASEEEEQNLSAEMPEQPFQGEIDGLLVDVLAPEGAFPAGTTMKLSLVETSEVRASVEGALEDVTEIVTIKAVDITFYGPDGEEVEPLIPISVVIKDQLVADADEVKVVHVDDEGTGSVISKDSAKSTADDEVAFNAGSFSTYAIVEVITTKVITSDGDTYNVSLTYTSAAHLPEGAYLTAEEILADSSEYESYYNAAAAAMGAVYDLRLFDITIHEPDGTEFEPLAPVTVKIEYVDPMQLDSKKAVSVVHFAETGTEILQPSTNKDEDGSADEFSFETGSLSIYAIVSYGLVDDLDGQTVAIAHLSSKPLMGVGNLYGVTGMPETKMSYLGITLQKDLNTVGRVLVEHHTAGQYLVTCNNNGTAIDGFTAGPDITQWTFHAVEGGESNQYTIECASVPGQYLNLNSDGTISLSATPQTLTVGAGPAAYPDRITISAGTTYLKTNANYVRGKNANSNDVSNNPFPATPKYTTGNYAQAYCLFTLCGIEEEQVGNTVYTASKISASETVNDGLYIIYSSVWNEQTEEFELYCIDGYGRLVRCYDKGDSITLYSNNLDQITDPSAGTVSSACPVWALRTKDNGYCYLMNIQTGKMLQPWAGDQVVAVVPDGFDWQTDESSGVRLPGREGAANSKITYYNTNSSDPTIYGYTIIQDAGTGEFLLKTCDESQSLALSFAGLVTKSTEGLHEVDTVNSSDMGIHMHMFNYPRRDTIHTITGSDGFADGQLQNRTIDLKLDSSGLPTFGGRSSADLFGTGSTHYQGTANKLFLQSVYSSTGYFEYSCFNNFAHYDEDTDEFTVYEEIGAPDGSKFSFNRGNFLPYNNLDVNATKVRNLFDGYGYQLDYQNPAYGDEILYKIESPDYYFGMTMDFQFMMPVEGKINGSPMVYEFNGDDDLYIFIDGVLVLDLGGVHNAWPGTINFETGQVTVPPGISATVPDRNTTIKEAFWQAKVFPDGSAWTVYDDPKVEHFFNGDTFVDYSGHTFNMFFMEHGAGASNLYMHFNIPVVPEGQVMVKKELTRVNDRPLTEFVNMAFDFQALKVVHEDEEHPENNVYNPVDASEIRYNFKVGADGEIEDVSGLVWNDPSRLVTIDADGVFQLKPEEEVVIELPEGQKYVVSEINVDTSLITATSYNNNAAWGSVTTDPDTDLVSYTTTAATSKQRPRVDVKNTLSAKEKLRITKQLADGVADNGDYFEFRILLENRAGGLSLYSYERYWMVDEENHICSYNPAEGRHVPTTYIYPNDCDALRGITLYNPQTSQWGLVEGVKPGMTIIIEDLVPGTDYYVDEIRVFPHVMDDSNDKVNFQYVTDASDPDNIVCTYTDLDGVPNGWHLASVTVTDTNASQISDSVYSFADDGNKTVDSRGSIKAEGQNLVTFTNEGKYQMNAVKIWDADVWEGKDFVSVSNHGTVWMALFEDDGSGGYTYVPGTVKQLYPTTGSNAYNFMYKEPTLNYYIFEVQVTWNGSEIASVTPILENQVIAVSGETTIYSASSTNSYVVHYEDNYDPNASSSGSTAADDEPRTVEIHNVLPRLKVVKVGKNGVILPGAKLSLLKEDMSILDDAYSQVVSAADTGLLFENVYLSNGTYYLVETAAPNGYLLPESPFKIVVSSTTDGVFAASQGDTAIAVTVTPDSSNNNLNLDYTFEVPNEPGVMLPKTGGPGTLGYTLGGLACLAAGATIAVVLRRRRRSEA